LSEVGNASIAGLQSAKASFFLVGHYRAHHCDTCVDSTLKVVSRVTAKVVTKNHHIS
jgi:hypothetical protein